MAHDSFDNEDMVFKDKYRNLKRKLKFLIYVKKNNLYSNNQTNFFY
jgi:hypothetical protein